MNLDKAVDPAVPGDITVGERPDPRIEQPMDAVVRVLLGCVRGSAL